MTTIRLLVVIADDEKRLRLTGAFAGDVAVAVAGAGPDLNQAFISSPQAYLADVIAVDLDAPTASDPRFWTTLHVMYPAARLMVMVSQPLSEEALQAALHAGAHSFALWADDPERLREAARAAYEGKRFYSAPWLIVAAQKLIRDLETGLIQTTIVRRGAGNGHYPPAVGLTALESRVLAYLIRREGETVSAAELVSQVWKHDAEGDISNLVNCCIRRLRRKLSLNPANPHHIQTVRGQGYRIASAKPPEEN